VNSLATSRSPSRHDSSFEICEACATTDARRDLAVARLGVLCEKQHAPARAMRARVAQRRRDRHARTDRVSGRGLDLERQLLPRLISNATAGEGRYCAATKPLSRPSSPIGGPGQPLTVCEWTIPSTDASAERTPSCQVAYPRKFPANQIPDTL
jgi:hypothetical protein